MHTVISLRYLEKDVLVLRFTRNKLDFITGQYLLVGPFNYFKTREYSIYSGENDTYLEILIKEIPHGQVSPLFSKLKPGDPIFVQGPFGFFTLKNLSAPFLFLATGTGISPFHSFIRTYPTLSYQLLHGIPYLNSTYDHLLYHNYIACLSQEKDCFHSSDNDIAPYVHQEHPISLFPGRLTQYLSNLDLHSETLAYLCGHCDMIYDSFDILQKKNISSESIFTEVYY